MVSGISPDGCSLGPGRPSHISLQSFRRPPPVTLSRSDHFLRNVMYPVQRPSSSMIWLEPPRIRKKQVSGANPVLSSTREFARDGLSMPPFSSDAIANPSFSDRLEFHMQARVRFRSGERALQFRLRAVDREMALWVEDSINFPSRSNVPHYRSPQQQYLSSTIRVATVMSI